MKLTRVRETSQEISPTLACMSGIGQVRRHDPVSAGQHEPGVGFPLHVTRSGSNSARLVPTAASGRCRTSTQYALPRVVERILPQTGEPMTLEGAARAVMMPKPAMYSGMAR